MTREVRGYMIIVNGKMAPEIALSSFLRELGRAAAAEPYRSAVAKIANPPIWIKYSSQARP
jgi:hypothetical protein